MEEKNKESLKKAIDNLTKYSPGERLWDNLSDALNNAEADKVLHESIKELPKYIAPDHIWSKIENGLEEKHKRRWLTPLLAAASIAILLGIFWKNSLDNFGQEIVNVSYSEQQIEATKFIHVTNITSSQRDSAFRTIVRSQKKSSDNAKVILAELEQLESARIRLKSKIGKYDINKDLENKLLRIEQESVELQQAYLANI